MKTKVRDNPEFRRLLMAKVTAVRLYGPYDARTVAASAELIRFRIAVAEAEISGLRAELAGLEDGVAA